MFHSLFACNNPFPLKCLVYFFIPHLFCINSPKPWYNHNIPSRFLPFIFYHCDRTHRIVNQFSLDAISPTQHTSASHLNNRKGNWKLEPSPLLLLLVLYICIIMQMYPFRLSDTLWINSEFDSQIWLTLVGTQWLWFIVMNAGD